MELKDIVGAGDVGKELIKQTSEIVKEPIANLTNPATKTVGHRIGEVFDLIFTPFEIAKIYKDHSIEKFKNKLSAEIANIPENKRVTPPLNIVGPALEASKFFIEEETLREMFARLVAKSMNSDTTHQAHPAFIEVIKQISPLDAKIFSFFKSNGVAPVVTYFMKGSKIPLVPNVTLFPKNPCTDIYAISASVTNLIRLGLLHTDFDRLANENDYSRFGDDEVFQQIYLRSNSQRVKKTKPPIDLIHFEKGILRRTIIGMQFISVCL